MQDYQPLYDMLSEHRAVRWSSLLPQQLGNAFAAANHGDLPKWRAIIESLPVPETSCKNLQGDAIQIGRTEDINDVVRTQLKAGLAALHPWRKGPYQLFGINLDAEWRSDWKWRRLQEHIAPLQNRLVLDVGCGNGYHCWRMLGSGAKMVVGIDPTLLSVMQFQAIYHLYGLAPIYVLPLKVQDIPDSLQAFDTVFSMGVFYHRRSPMDHLLELKGNLRQGGELVLETLVIEGRNGDVLIPERRYAKMRNVWFIPSCATLISWLQRCGFINIRLLDISKTTPEEQRSTEWMHFHSLTDFLDRDNPDLTVEGLPAPVRAIFIAEAP
jgi:tRNA (mo5U34)-methyltransferase